MTPDTAAAFTFTDFQGLGALRREAAQDTPEAKRAVAQQFEALFLSLVLKEMRTASRVEGGLFDGESMQLYQDLHDRQLALTLSQGPGIGLAEAIYRELGGEPTSVAERAPLDLRWPGASAPGSRPPAGSSLAWAVPGVAERALTTPERRLDSPARHALRGPGAASNADPALAASPNAFVAMIRPHAERAAAVLGTSADVLIAQAALETGWGKHVIRAGDGASTFNLFGIKATGGWQGGRATVSTLEFVDGLPERRREAFRAYGSVGESFDDYVSLIRTSPRYRDALRAETPEAYARALADGGYSTDPAYAEKILAILERGLPDATFKADAGSADREWTPGHPADDARRGGST